MASSFVSAIDVTLLAVISEAGRFSLHGDKAATLVVLLLVISTIYLNAVVLPVSMTAISISAGPSS